jgi:ABC-type multidrug transport system permease subunit
MIDTKLPVNSMPILLISEGCMSYQPSSFAYRLFRSFRWVNIVSTIKSVEFGRWIAISIAVFVMASNIIAFIVLVVVSILLKSFVKFK